MKINIEDTLFDNIVNLYLNIDNTDFVKFNTSLKAECKNNYNSFQNFFGLYMNYLTKKFDGDYVKACVYFIKKFILKSNVIEVRNIINADNEISISNLEITFDSDKKLFINIPISYTEEYSNYINKFLNKINYFKIKEKSIDKVYEIIFDYYMNSSINNLIVFESNVTTSGELYTEKNTEKSLYVFTNKSDNKDIILMIIEDFINNNSKYIDGFNYDKSNNKIKLIFSNGKHLEIYDKILIEKLNNKLNVLENNLIDKKIKQLRLKNE